MSRAPFQPATSLEVMEPRIMMSADPLTSLIDAGFAEDAAPSDHDVVADLRAALEREAPATPPAFEMPAVDSIAPEPTTTTGQTHGLLAPREELLFVDANTPDVDSLINAMGAANPERHLTVIMLDAERDGIEQIDAWLAGANGVDAVHVVGHGAAGGIQLGSTWLDAHELEKRAATIGGWAGSLSDEADLLLYGCDVAGSAEGRELVIALARLTGADVAASIDLTGQAALGGDWDLEFSAGDVDSALVLSAQASADWSGVLAAPAPDGTETLLNTTAFGTQHDVDIASLSGGKYVAAWTDGFEVAFRRFDADGTPLDASEVTLPSGFGIVESNPSLSSNGGTFVLVYESTSIAGSDIYAAKYDSTGAVLIAPFKVNSGTGYDTGNQSNPDVALRGNGTFTVVWQGDGPDDADGGIYYKSFNGAGGTATAETLVNATTTGVQDSPSIAINNGGDRLIAWRDSDGIDHIDAVFLSKTDSFGAYFSPGTATNEQASPDVESVSGPTFVVTWQENQGASVNDILVRRYDDTGVPLETAQQVNTVTSDQQTGPRISAATGGYAITWQTANGVDDPGHGIAVREYSTSGVAEHTVETRVNTSTASDQSAPAIGYSGSNNFVVAWSGNGTQTGQVDSNGIFAQRFVGTLTNLAPTVALANTVTTQAENTSTATRIKVADITVTDDGLGTNTLSLTGADASLFEIDGTELFIRAGTTLDFETNPSLDVTVNVDDPTVGATPDDTAALTVSITDVNEAPTVALSNTVTTLPESTSTVARIKVADIVVSDDALGTNTLTLTGTDAALFEIDGTELFIRAGTTLDFETNPTLDVTVNVDDATVGATPDDTASLAVTITDVNEAPTIALANTVTTQAENTSTATRIKVADITVTDDGLGTNTLSLTGDDASLFEIDGTELFIRAGTTLDFETNPSLDVTVNVDDTTVGATPDDTASLSVALTDVNEAPSVSLTNTVTSLAENVSTADRISVADIVISDDALGTETLTLTGTDAALFEIDANVLYLRAGTVLDFETNPTLDVTVNVDDATVGATPDDTASLAVTITDVNEAPTIALANTVTTLAEDASTVSRVKVADIVVSDDALGTETLTLSGADAALFEIDGTELFIRAGTTLDFETNPTLDVVVSVDDPTVGGTPDDSAALAMTITDVNEAPTVTLVNTVTSLAEDTSTVARIRVADITITDDALGSETLTLTGTDAALFEIDGNQLYLRAGAALDFETNPTLDVTVNVDDATIGATPDDTADLAVSITNVNEAPTVTLANTVTTQAENTSTATRIKVADINVSDDGTGTNTVTLTGDDASLFEVDGTELFIRAGTTLDFETNPSLDVTVNVDDPTIGATPDDTAALTVAVTDVNEAPSVALANTVTSLSEGASTITRIKVADIVVTDDALGAETLTLTGADAVLFEVDGTELFLRAGITLNATLNPVLDVTVNVDDPTVGATPDDTAPLAISVTVANAPPSVALADTVTTLAEDTSTAARVKVANIAVTDDGNGTNNLTLTGTDAALFEIDGTELFIKAGATLDFETNPSLDVTVNVDDPTVGATPDDTASLTITLTDSNDAPTVALANTVTTQAENTSTATRIKVADIVVTDDALGSETLSLTGADAALFEIDGTELFIRAGTTLDFETNPSLDVTVNVDDPTVGASPDASTALSVAITDVNEAPTVALANTVTTLAENTSTVARIKVADINITDDALGSETLTLAGTDAALFELDGTELFISAGTTLDFESKPTLDVTVQVDDVTVGATPDDTAALSIAVTDVNEAPTIALANTVTTLPESTSTVARVKVADINVSDDALGTETLTLGGADAALFEIDGTELFIRAGTTLDFETNPSLDVTIDVDDPTVGATPDDTAVLAISVTDVNEAPTVSVTTVIASLPEDRDTTARIRVADIVVTDDALGTETLSLTGADAALFEIDGSGLFLRAGAVLDFETNPSLDVVVNVDDSTVGATPDDTAAFSLAITDVNERPDIALANTVTTLPEDTPTATRVKVADINIIDDALGSETLTLSGADAALFEVDGTELFIRAGTTLDFETNPTLSVIVRVDDPTVGTSPDATASLAITITDVNEAPTLTLTGTVTSIAETTSTAARIKVADINVTDDGLGTETLALTGDDAALFEIDGTELYLRAGTVLDAGLNRSLDVTVTIDDVTVGGTPDAAVPLSITVTSLNAPPTVTLTNTVTALAENSADSARVRVADIVVTDDGNGTNTLGLAGADAERFEIDSSALYLRAGTPFDFESDASLDVSVTVDDTAISGGIESTAALTVTATDVNEAPSMQIVNVVASVSENAADGGRVRIADIVITDDALGDESLTLTGADAALFEVDGTTVFLRAGAELDGDARSALNFSVHLDDVTLGAGAEGVGNLTVTVQPGDDETDEDLVVASTSSTARSESLRAASSDESAADEDAAAENSAADAQDSGDEAPVAAAVAAAAPSDDDEAAAEAEAEAVADDGGAVAEEIGLVPRSDDEGEGEAPSVGSGFSAAELMRSAVFKLLNDSDDDGEQSLEALLFMNRGDNLSPDALNALQAFTDGLDGLRNDADAELAFARAVIGGGVAASAGLSVGYVAWLIRGGVLVSSVLSSLPAWRFIDPLPVLASTLTKGSVVDVETLQSIASSHTFTISDPALETPLDPTPEPPIDAAPEASIEPTPEPPVDAAQEAAVDPAPETPVDPAKPRGD